MHLAVVTCGERLEETLTMIKSAVLFSIKLLHLHIFAEDQLHASFVEAVRIVFIFMYRFHIFFLIEPLSEKAQKLTNIYMYLVPVEND